MKVRVIRAENLALISALSDNISLGNLIPQLLELCDKAPTDKAVRADYENFHALSLFTAIKEYGRPEILDSSSNKAAS
ncbi:hypothetical protein D3C76_1609870 [compost metagenome]